MQISAASPSPKFYSGKSYVKKIPVFTFSQFVSTSDVKLKSELEVVGILFRDRILVSVQPLTYHIGKSQLKE